MKKIILAFVFLGVIASIWLFYPSYSRYVVGTDVDSKTTEQSGVSKWALTGQHGDTYGGLTSLFTMLAFWGLLITIWLQLCQLKEQRLSSAADRTPFVDWDPPVLHIVGRWNCDGHEYVGAVIKTVVASMTVQPILNPVIGFEIRNSKGRVVARSACDYRGGMFTEKRNLLFVSYLWLKCNEDLLEILDALVSRYDLSLNVKLCYMNNSGEAFVRQRVYGVDCPSDECRSTIEKMRTNVSSRVSLSDDEKMSWQAFRESIMALAIEDKDTFVQPFVSCISKITPQKSGPIQASEYENDASELESIARSNCISYLGSYGESFAVKTNRKLNNI